MYSTRMNTLDIALAVLCAMFVLTLAAPRAGLAVSPDQTVGTSHKVFDACAEPYRLLSVVQSFEATLHMPRPYAASRLQEEALHTELQVPAALWRTLVLPEGNSRSLELHIPAALLATLSADARLQRPQRSQQPCPLFFPLY